MKRVVREVGTQLRFGERLRGLGIPHSWWAGEDGEWTFVNPERESWVERDPVQKLQERQSMPYALLEAKEWSRGRKPKLLYSYGNSHTFCSINLNVLHILNS